MLTTARLETKYLYGNTIDVTVCNQSYKKKKVGSLIIAFMSTHMLLEHSEDTRNPKDC